MSTELEKAAPAGHVTLPVTGEAIDLSKPDEVVRAGHALKEMSAQIRTAKSRVDEAAREHLRAGGLRMFAFGGYQAKEKTGSAIYNADAIYEKAIELEIPEEAVNAMLPLARIVKSGTELNALANRDDRWRQALAAGVTRKPGSLEYEIRRDPAAAPVTPEAVKHAVAKERRELRDVELEAEDLGT